MMNDLMTQALSDWRILNTMLAQFNESEVKEMLDKEATGKRRKMFIERLHQRFCSLRTKREREELLA